MRILAVDDEPLFLELLSEALAEIGYSDVTAVGTAEDAILAMNTSPIPFDCFLLDIQMPGTNGIELCRYIRRKVVYRNAPVLMVTAMSEKQFVDSAFAVGATDYINKPLEIAELRARLRTIRVLIEKSHQNLAMQAKIREFGNIEKPRFSFEDPILMHDVDGLIDFLALENYLLKLGNMRMFIYSSIGFHVINGHEIYHAREPQDYLDLMSDVADAIKISLCGQIVFLSYAGRGDFVGIVPKAARVNKDNVEDQIVTVLDQHMEVWGGLGSPIPRLQVGSPINQSLMSLRRPSHALDAAISSARNPRPNTYLRRLLRLTG